MRSKAASAATLVLLMVAVVLLIASCAGEAPADTSTTRATASTTTASSQSAATSSTSPPVTLSQYEKELADTAGLTNELVRSLDDQSLAADDPRAAVIYGLRARTVALFCRKSLAEGDLENARTSMTDVYANINRGRNAAEGDVAQILQKAYAAVESVGDPTSDPEQAAARLDEFIALLEPVMGVATALLNGEGTATTG